MNEPSVTGDSAGAVKPWRQSAIGRAQDGEPSGRWRRRVLGAIAAAGAGALLAAGCGGSESSGEERLRTAVRDLLGEEVVSARFVIVEDDSTVSEGVEHFAPSTGDFDLIEDETGNALHRRLPALYLDGDSIRAETDGRLLELDPADDVSDEVQFGELGDLYVRGLLGRYLEALLDPGEVTTIGRAVVASQATTHLLVEPSAGTENPVEVWVSDDSTLVQLKYLTTGGLTQTIEVVLQIVPGPGRLTPIASDATVTEVALAEEREREAEELAAAEAAAERAEQERIDAERAPLEELADEAEALATTETDALEAWLDENWWDAVGPGSIATQTSTGHACIQVDARMSLQLMVQCTPLPPAEVLEPVCAAADGLATAFASGSGYTSWVAAADAFVDAAAVFSAPAAWYQFDELDAGFALTYVNESSQLTNEAAYFREVIGIGMEGSGLSQDRVMWVTGVVDGFCGVGINLPNVLLYPLPADPELLARVGDDPLFPHLPIDFGAQGDHVRALQQALIDIGLGVGASGADGQFGPATQSAIGQLQYQSGLDMTERLDVETLEMLRFWQADITGGIGCPSPAEIEDSYLSFNEEVVSVSQVQCAVMPRGARIAVYAISVGNRVEYVAASEGHVAWIEMTRSADRAVACAAAREFIEQPWPESLSDALASLRC